MSMGHGVRRDVGREWQALYPTLRRVRGYRQADMRAANRACVLEELAHGGSLSRIALAHRLQLSRTTIGHIVAELLSEGKIREDGFLPATESGGRRATLLSLGGVVEGAEGIASER
jgi:hypothetical protein